MTAGALHQYVSAAGCLLALAAGGCAGLPRPIVACPLTYSEQAKEILAVAPKGTDRDEVVRRLSAAGIEGSFGISRRIYYCDVWKRSTGDRWQMNVALLFDESGRLYNTQTAQCEITAEPDDAAGASAAPARHANAPASRSASSAAPPR